MPTMSQVEYVTVEAAAYIAQVSSATIRRALALGELHYRGQRGRARLLDATEVRKWKDERGRVRPIENNGGAR